MKGKSKIELCVECLADSNIFCKRDPDVICLHCGLRFCGGHIVRHLEKNHFVSMDNRHCSLPTEVAK